MLLVWLRSYVFEELGRPNLFCGGEQMLLLGRDFQVSLSANISDAAARERPRTTVLCLAAGSALVADVDQAVAWDVPGDGGAGEAALNVARRNGGERERMSFRPPHRSLGVRLARSNAFSYPQLQKCGRESPTYRVWSLEVVDARVRNIHANVQLEPRKQQASRVFTFRASSQASPSAEGFQTFNL